MHVSPALLLQWRCLLFSPILLMNTPRPRELGINSTRSDYWPVAGQGFWPKFVSISTRWYCISFIWNSCAFSTSTSISPIKSQQLFVEKLQDFLRRDKRLCPQVALWKCNWADQHSTDWHRACRLCTECLCRVACHWQVGGQQDPVSSLL